MKVCMLVVGKLITHHVHKAASAEVVLYQYHITCGCSVDEASEFSLRQTEVNKTKFRA